MLFVKQINSIKEWKNSKSVEMTKKYNNNFGCHSNGSLLTELEKSIGFCSRLIELGDAEIDYYSCSLDAGSVESHSKTKNIKKRQFKNTS